MSFIDTVKGLLGTPAGEAAKPKTQRECAELAASRKALRKLTLREIGHLTKKERLAFLGSNQRLAQHLPLSRFERKKLKLPAIKPSRGRSTPPIAHPLAVDSFLEQVKPESAAQLVAMLGRAHGYPTIEATTRACQSARRYFTGDRRIPSHMRERMVLSSAVMLAVSKAFPETQPQEVLDAAAKLRGDFAPQQAA